MRATCSLLAPWQLTQVGVRASAATACADFAYFAKSRIQSDCMFTPRSFARRQCSSDSVGTWKGSVPGQPYFSLVSAISSLPSGSPWAFAVSARLGEPNPMIVRVMIIEGRCVSGFAAAIALSICAWSFTSAMWSTCQP